MLRIASYNVNGIRATAKRNYADWLTHRGIDVLGLQEVRCRVKDLPERCFGDYWTIYNPGELAGRNGVALCTTAAVSAVRSWGEPVAFAPDGSAVDLPSDTQTTAPDSLADYGNEGRYLEVDLSDAPITVGCLYLPKGATLDDNPDKYHRKQNFMAKFAEYVHEAVQASHERGREFVVMGDFNIAHTNQDLKNWKGNQKSEGFLPEERAWVSDLLATGDVIDVFRSHHLDEDGPYSWWSWRGQAFTRDSGWRIDYQFATPALAQTSQQAVIDREDDYASRRSDHAALVIDYDIDALAQ